MSFSKSDLADIKWSLGAFVLSLALGGSFIAYSESYLEKSQKDRQSAQQHLTDARAQLAVVELDRENMAAYALEYNALLAQKVIGDEQRLDWKEGLAKLSTQNRVLDFKYSIAPQQGYTPNPPLDAGNFQLNRSNMSLQFDLLHEGQMLDFFAAMLRQLKGWFILDDCTIERSDQAALKANCSGGWVTMKNRNAP
ncbi:MAG TPA: hypothetical protein VK149_04725 [Sideroxyarcus sp.]|nr:hypothetical protein [Sideroxyarcus sp.]